MCDRVMLTPLTPDEQLFAEENHSALEWCMRIQKLDAELYDVAAFGYLLAVKKWFARPDLQRWSFKTIVRQSVRSSLSAEQRKRERRIKAISLDDVIPGADALTYGDTVTEENIRYLTGGKEKMAVKISYNVKIPETAKVGKATSVEVETLLAFLDSNSKTLCFEYEDKKEADRKSSTLRTWKKNHQRTDFIIYKMAETIYIEKVAVKPKKGEKQ